MPTLARILLFGTLTAMAFGVSFSGTPTPSGTLRAETAPTGRVVYLGRGLGDEALATLSATVAAQGNGVILLDSPKLSPYLRAFLAAYQPTEVVPVGAYPDGITELEQRLNRRVAPVVTWTRGPPVELWQKLFPRAANVVVCPAQARAQMLQAACLAGVLRAPLFLTQGKDDLATLHALLAQWHTRQVYLVGQAVQLKPSLAAVRTVRLADETAVAAAHRRHLARRRPIQNLVVANPADTSPELGGMSALAPWVALQKRAALVFTGTDGKDADGAVRRAIDQEELRRADTLIFVANLLAIPMQVRPNPIPADKDAQIEMEPLTPGPLQPFSFATGRLFHEDPAVIPLLLARQYLLQMASGPRKALVASNPGGSLSLLETLSRNTAQEFQNAGYDTTALFGKDVTSEELRKLLTVQDIFLWEGHHNTLIRDWDFPSWDEPMRPSLVFLQSCLALKDYKVQPLLSRGAIGVIGSSTRTYSGSGGACSLAFFDALFYEQQSLGGSLRQAKNFLLAYALLKEKRLGKDATRTGANLRAAWAFTLWGDPTVKLPSPRPPQAGLAPIRHEVSGRSIVVELPPERHAKVKTEKYQIAMAPNARLAGLLRKEKEDDRHPLVPFVFAEVHLPRGHAGQTPHLRTNLPSSHWVFCWDDRRRCGYLLVTPRAKDQKEIRFHVEWPSLEVANPAAANVGSGQ
jgi:hypothetical protein